jgi:thioredoxin-like negative regulator of GroEL
LLARTGKFSEAAACLHDAAAMAPESIPIRIELCEALVAGGERESALQVCAEVDVLARESRDANAVDAAVKLRRDCEGVGGR